MEELIRVEHVSYTYDGENTANAYPAVRDLTFSVGRGEFVAILGHNGSGKSTAAKLIASILTPDQGDIYIAGKKINDEGLTEEERYDLRKRVGMVFQNPDNQIVATIVEEDVAFGPENLGIPSDEIRRRVDEALATVGMSEYARHAPHRLSGGQKQRVAIAGILAIRPECIIFDESTAMLDPQGRAEVMKTIEKLNREEGITILLITHYMEEAARADRILVTENGSVTMSGTPDEIFSRSDELRRAGLELPQGAQLIDRLNREYGFSIPNGVCDETECARRIVEALKERGYGND